MSTYARTPGDIVTKALYKIDDRYQTAKDLLIDLRNLKRKLEVDAEIARTAPVDLRTANTISNQRLPATLSGAKSTGQATESHSVSSAEYIVKQIKQHRRTAVVLFGVLAIAGAAILFWYFKHTRAALLTDKDSILLTELITRPAKRFSIARSGKGSQHSYSRSTSSRNDARNLLPRPTSASPAIGPAKFANGRD